MAKHGSRASGQYTRGRADGDISHYAARIYLLRATIRIIGICSGFASVTKAMGYLDKLNRIGPLQDRGIRRENSTSQFLSALASFHPLPLSLVIWQLRNCFEGQKLAACPLLTWQLDRMRAYNRSMARVDLLGRRHRRHRHGVHAAVERSILPIDTRDGRVALVAVDYASRLRVQAEAKVEVGSTVGAPAGPGKQVRRGRLGSGRRVAAALAHDEHARDNGGDDGYAADRGTDGDGDGGAGGACRGGCYGGGIRCSGLRGLRVCRRLPGRRRNG